MDAMFAKPPLAIDQTQPHERLLSRSPLERLAVLADAHAATRLERKSVVTIVQSDDRTVFDEIRDANADLSRSASGNAPRRTRETPTWAGSV